MLGGVSGDHLIHFCAEAGYKYLDTITDTFICFTLRNRYPWVLCPNILPHCQIERPT